MGDRPESAVFRFGDFELDLESEELRKTGTLIKLQLQPFRVLALLAGRAGRVVNREEIRQEIWGDDTVVDFGGGLNFCLNQIRAAVGDDAKNPRYIETLPRRGYRFIARVKKSPRRPGIGLLSAGTAAIALIVLAVVLLWYLPKRPLPSIVVLPPENLPEHPEDGYLGTGVWDGVITELGKISGLRVISRTSTEIIAKKGFSLPKIAESLNANVVVEMTVRHSGEGVRVNTRVLLPDPERQLGADSLEDDLQNIPSLQRRVALAIAQAIGVKLTAVERARLAVTRPVNPEVYELYLKGRHYATKWTPESIARGLEYFQQAIEKDPGYAPSYSGVATCYNVMAFMGYIRPKEAYERAKTAATKALEIDDSLAEAHTTLGGSMFYYDRNWSAAEREYRNALVFNPNYQYAHRSYAWYLAAMGRKQEALAETKRAQQLDPISVPIRISAGSVFYMVRRYDQAIEQFKQAIELDPNSVFAHNNLSWPYLEKGRYEEGIAAVQKALTLAGDNPYVRAEVARGYAVAGKRGKAQEILDELKALSKQRYVSPYNIALIHLGLGQKEQAFEWLEKAYNDRASWMVWLKVDPRFDPLRSDPRFQDLLRRMNFPE